MAVNPVFQFFQPGVFDIVSQEQDFGGVVHPPVLLLSYVDYILHVGEAFALQMSALAGFQFRQHGIGHLHEVAVFFAVDDAERVHIRVLAQVFQFGLFVIGVYRYVDGAYFGAGVQQVSQSGTFAAQMPTCVPRSTPIAISPFAMSSTLRLNWLQVKRRLRSE